MFERGQFDEAQIPLARQKLLQLVNEERTAAGLSELLLDDLACEVATAHAQDMVEGRFLSHWGRNGLKPYQRYSFAGGRDAVQENASAAENIESASPPGVHSDLRDMLAEKPPNDGHRKTILFPSHTHVGFGIALSGHSLRMDELYLARYLHLDSSATKAKPRDSVLLTGRLLDRHYLLPEVDVFYEPLPSPPDIQWLRVKRSVSLPEELMRLRPQLPAGAVYSTDGGRGEFSRNHGGEFRVPVKLFHDEPGIYTVLFWVRRNAREKPFPGGQVCIVGQK